MNKFEARKYMVNISQYMVQNTKFKIVS